MPGKHSTNSSVSQNSKAEENPKIHMETCKIPQLVKSNPKQKDLYQRHDKTLDP